MVKGLYDSIDSQSSMRYFTWWVLVSQVLGLTSVVLVAVWMGHFRGGFAWQENPGLQFNYHPLFMIIGMVFLFADAMLVYRVFRNDRKIFVKVLHACLQACALLFAGVGLKAVFDSHNLPAKPINNMYSLHSWMGIATIVLFGLQWVSGFVSFLFPGTSMDLRSSYKPVHVYWGIGIFVMAIATSLMGITEKAFFSVKNYSTYPGEGFLINILGVVLVLLGLTVVYILIKTEWRRQPLPEEEHIQLQDE